MKNDQMETIKENLAVILGYKEGDLAESIRILDDLKASATGHLSHYLSKRSYEKAWILLGDGDPEKGICGTH